jgi:hypothetical protein
MITESELRLKPLMMKYDPLQEFVVILDVASGKKRTHTEP